MQLHVVELNRLCVHTCFRTILTDYTAFSHDPVINALVKHQFICCLHDILQKLSVWRIPETDQFTSLLHFINNL